MESIIKAEEYPVGSNLENILNLFYPVPISNISKCPRRSKKPASYSPIFNIFYFNRLHIKTVKDFKSNKIIPLSNHYYLNVNSLIYSLPHFELPKFCGNSQLVSQVLVS